jgi:hypothetical protein
MMRHDHHKQRLDDSIVVDTSSGRSDGWAAGGASARAMKPCPPRVRSSSIWR